MTAYNIIIGFFAASIFFFSFYIAFTVIFIHKKINDKHFYFMCNAFVAGFFDFFQILMTIPFQDNNYLLFHRIRLLSIEIALPFFMLTLYSCYFKNAKRTIPLIFLFISPIFMIFSFSNLSLSLPIDSIQLSILGSKSIFHFASPNIVYKIWVVFLFIFTVLSVMQFLLSKDSEKKYHFIVLIFVFFLAFINDVSLTSRLFSGIPLGSLATGVVLLFIFIDFLFEDRKAYIAVLNLSKELQRHKEDLEITVEERTKELQIEKAKTEELLLKSDQLLLNVLPDQIAERLKQGEQPIADHFDEASVVFIDIVDFTKLSAKSTPQKMVNMLNEVFTHFDKIAEKYGLEKIKTIGDCYMAAAGIPIHRTDHAEAIARMAIESMETMNGFITEDGHEIQFRVGLDCGPIVAGVIGKQKFIYDLWGDMVNTASRMETNGITGRIQCTERFKEKLGSRSEELGIKLEERGEIEVKGKGMMKTYFIN